MTVKYRKRATYRGHNVWVVTPTHEVRRYPAELVRALGWEDRQVPTREGEAQSILEEGELTRDD